MSDLIAPLQSNNVILSQSGLLFHPDMEAGEWSEVGDSLLRMQDWVQFALGDWLNFGYGKWGEALVLQVLPDGYASKTLDNFARVCEQIPLSRRRDGVSYSHHVEVARQPPDDQIALLGMARSPDNLHGLSVRGLRHFIQDNGLATPEDKPRYCPTCNQVWL